jgi:hypothetical protein
MQQPRTPDVMDDGAIDQAVEALTRAIAAHPGARGAAPAAAVNVASLPLRCIVTAAAKYGACRLSGGSNCEIALVGDIVACFKNGG